MSELTTNTDPSEFTDANIQGMLAAAQGCSGTHNPYVFQADNPARQQWSDGFTLIRTAMDNAYELAWSRATQQSLIINPFTGHKEQ